MELALQPDVAAKYNLVVVKPGIYNFPGYGEIDLTQLTVKSADALVGRGFAWLVVKAAPVKPAKPLAVAPAPAPEPGKEETPAGDAAVADQSSQDTTKTVGDDVPKENPLS